MKTLQYITILLLIGVCVYACSPVLSHQTASAMGDDDGMSKAQCLAYKEMARTEYENCPSDIRAFELQKSTIAPSIGEDAYEGMLLSMKNSCKSLKGILDLYDTLC